MFDLFISVFPVIPVILLVAAICLSAISHKKPEKLIMKKGLYFAPVIMGALAILSSIASVILFVIRAKSLF